MDIASLVVSVAGLVVAVCGFAIAIWQIRRTRTAAEHAEAAARAARESIFSVTSLLDLSQASMLIEQLKELYRNNEWRRAVDRYTQLRQILTRAKSRLPEEKRDKIDDAINQLVSLEVATNGAITDRTDIDAAEFHNILLTMQQDINETLAEIEYNLSDTS